MGAQDDARRLRVASLYLRGLSPLEICTALQKGGISADLETVCADIAFLETVWATEVQMDHEQHQARILAELREVRRASWAAGERALVLKALEQEAKLLENAVPAVRLTRLR